MQPTLSFNVEKVDKQWEHYGLTQLPVLFNGSKSGWKAIVRDSEKRGQEIINLVSEGYHLLPNEEAIKVADQAAELAGFVQFKPPNRFGWYKGNVEGNVLYNRDRTVIHTLYIPEAAVPKAGPGEHRWTDGFGVGQPLKGDNVFAGVDVSNSIDGTRSFGAGIFTFRCVCSNGAIVGYQSVEGISHIHTKGLQTIVDSLKDNMIGLMDSAASVMDRYKQMATERATKELLERFKKTELPQNVLPGYIKTEDQTPLGTNIENLTQWDVYNDLTRNIWHNNKNDIGTKEQQFREVHKILLPPIRA